MGEAFRLYEGLLWDPADGYYLLERHLARLERSAGHFGFALDAGDVRRQLDRFAEGLPPRPRKVRLELSADGEVALFDVDVKPSHPVRVALAREPVDASDVFLRHKTSRRQVYEGALAAHPEADDVLLWNGRRELTEACNANLVLEIEGRLLTPRHDAGLLPGTFREELLARGEIAERVLPVGALDDASRLFLVNSVRRWVPARLDRSL